MQFLRGGRYQQWKAQCASTDQTKKERMAASDHNQRQWEEAQRIANEEKGRKRNESNPSQEGHKDTQSAPQRERSAKWSQAGCGDHNANHRYSWESTQQPRVKIRQQNFGHTNEMVLQFLESKWTQLEETAKSQRKIGLRDVSFPLLSMLRQQVYDKKVYQTQVLRWHPDKFLQRFGTCLQESERDEVVKRVTEVFQILQKLRKD